MEPDWLGCYTVRPYCVMRTQSQEANMEFICASEYFYVLPVQETYADQFYRPASGAPLGKDHASQWLVNVADPKSRILYGM